MRRRTVIAVGLATLAIGPAHAQSPGFTTIFDGKTLEGWTTVGDPNITIADGVIQANKGDGWLVYEDQLADFEFRCETYTSHEANSRIFVRFPDKMKPSSKDGYEFNIFDKRPDPIYGTGAVVNIAKARNIQKAAAEP